VYFALPPCSPPLAGLGSNALRIKLLYSSTGEYNKTEIYKMAASPFVEVIDKEISEIKIKSVQEKTQKTFLKILKQLFGSGSVIIMEYSSRLRLGDYPRQRISLSANNC
jgi:hypothetical protein